MSTFRFKERSVLPGFGLSLGYALFYLSILVLIPLSTLFWKAGSEGWPHFVSAAFSPQAVASYKLTFGAALLAATVNMFAGLLVAWVLVRYSFWGKSLVDALVDMPFALPTAVGGIALATVYGPNGWIGAHLAKLGVNVIQTPIGIVIALIFISLPFVVRTVQPVLQELDAQLEEAASSLGASRWMTFRRVLFPYIWPALLTGTTLAFARAIGEYGSVIFITSNIPFRTQITPQLIYTRLDEYDYAGATAIAVVMLVVSFALLLGINALQAWSRKRMRG
ncbi:MAG: sulfate ABC transporter permease subunit CysT [Armatimonadetes bacterium]|nr:sulfate ABC transporter permease subunit CysT [Armatimonadota bacterium]